MVSWLSERGWKIPNWIEGFWWQNHRTNCWIKSHCHDREGILPWNIPMIIQNISQSYPHQSLELRKYYKSLELPKKLPYNLPVKSLEIPSYWISPTVPWHRWSNMRSCSIHAITGFAGHGGRADKKCRGLKPLRRCRLVAGSVRFVANLRFLAKIDYIDIDVDIDIDIYLISILYYIDYIDIDNRYRHSTLRIEKNLPAALRYPSVPEHDSFFSRAHSCQCNQHAAQQWKIQDCSMIVDKIVIVIQ